jgi:hypothetical protein
MTQAQISLPTPGVVRLVGRVENSRQTGTDRKTFRTLLVTPAADAFSHPSTVEVRSAGRLGTPGNEVDVLCSVIGFRNRPRKNMETGEVYPPSAQIVLQAIAA